MVITIEQAIEDLNFYDEYSWGGLSESFEIAIEAMEKQIPRKVICTPWEHDNRFNIYKCPSCGSTGGCQTSDGEALNFCNDCGQRLEW